MLRTNSKKAMENIKKEIMDSYEAANEYYTYEGREAKTDFNEICADILEAFRIEKLEHDCYYIAGRASKSEIFMDWMQGLPTAFPVSDDVFLRSAVDFLGEYPGRNGRGKSKIFRRTSRKARLQSPV